MEWRFHMKKIFVTKSSIAPFDEYVNEIKDIWETRWMTNMGEKHNLLERQLEEFLDVKNVALCVNGHSALEMCIEAMNLKGEIITTPFTFISTTNSIIRMGCTPVFCDIDPVTYTIDANKIEDLITDKTVAIMPVHVYGNVCDVEEIDRIAKKHNLKVIYDGAHTFAESYKGKGITSYGDASILSFHATKVFNTIEGGAICTNDDDLKKTIQILRDFGISGDENIDLVGTNSKMNEFTASMGICNLRHIGEELAKRKIVFDRYNENLKGVDGITLTPYQPELVRNYAYYPVIIDNTLYCHDRNELFEELKKNNIFARKYFYPLTNKPSCISSVFDSGNTPIAERISNSVLTLPMYADLDIETVDFICNIIKEFKNN